MSDVSIVIFEYVLPTLAHAEPSLTLRLYSFEIWITSYYKNIENFRRKAEKIKE